MGREVRDVLRESGLNVRVELIAAAAEEGGVLTEEAGEAIVMAGLESPAARDADVLVLCAPADISRKVYEASAARSPRPVIVDLTGVLEEEPAARLRAPLVETAPAPGTSGIQVIAHPAAIALALFFRALAAVQRLHQAVTVIFEPASQLGRGGMDELQKQTAGLLSFKALPKEVYDAQVSFNMLPQYGAEAPQSLGEAELRIERHLATLLGGAAVPMPSLRLIQAPVFHGYSISVWVEFEEAPDTAAIAEGLASEDIDVRTGDHEPPTNVGIAGQSGIAAGSISRDRNNARACWFWVVADNLRIAAESAAEVIREQ